METFFHKTSSMLEEIPTYFLQLERCNVSNSKASLIENKILALLDGVDENCVRLDTMVSKEPPHRRTSAKVQVDQLKYDCRHYRTSLLKMMHQKMVQEQEMRQREELLSRKFSANEQNTTILIDHSLQQNTSLQNAHRGMDELLGSGSSMLTNLREQRGTLKGARKKILDISNTLGLSNTVMRLIEKRAHQDKYVLFGGMFITCVIMVIVVKYLI